jgi:uncharacterized delta-60 repeat protein
MRAGRVVAVSLLVIGALLASAASALAAPGNYDRSFGDGGVVAVKHFDAGFRELSSHIAVGPEGDTYLLRCVGGCGNSVVVTRYLPDGKVDTSYGIGGTTPALGGIEGNTNEAAIAVDSEGRAVVASVLRQGLVLARLNPDGSADRGFSGGGVESRIECGCQGLHVAVDSSGRIVVDGRSTFTDYGEGPYALRSTSTLFFLRYLADGRPDPSFGENGKTIVTLEGIFTPQASLIQSDGGIVIAGGKRLQGVTTAFALRVEPNGSFQRTYGAALMQGPLTERLMATGVTALVGRPNGVRVLGNTEAGGGYVLALGVQGKVSHGFAQRGFRFLPWEVKSATGDARGRIVATGLAIKNHNLNAYRLLANGEPDRTFAGGRGVLLISGTGEESLVGSEVVMPTSQRPTVLATTAEFCRFQCAYNSTLFRLRGGNSSARCQGKIATIVGTTADDRLVGTPRRDVIVGLGGADVVYGRGGNDLICGGPGADQLHGGPGRDQVRQ